MKVALVGPVYPYRGGIAHYTTSLARALAKRHTVRVLSFRRQFPAWLYPGRSDKDPSREPVRVEAEYRLDPLNPVTWWQTGWQLARWRPDLVVVQWWVTVWAPAFATVAALCRRAGLPVAFLIHNVLPHETRWWDKPLAKMALQRGSRFIVHTEPQKQALLDLLPRARVRVCAMPVFDLFAWSKPSGEAARQKLGLPPGAPVLLFFGLVREYKGLRDLLDAMPAIRAELPEARLLIVGEFWHDKQAYLDQIERLGIAPGLMIVDRYVANEEAPTYFAAADVAVLPYVHVTQSAVAQLAFGFGVPVVTTRVGGLPEAVAEGETGWLVPPHNPAALAEAIINGWRTGEFAAARARFASNDKGQLWDQLAAALEEIAQNKA
ncbi:MAG: glycosyltransferase [Anaerolineales bacterium]